MQSKKKDRLRRIFLGSLWKFNWEIMGYRDIDNLFHRRELSIVDENRRKRVRGALYLWPRGHLKTSLLTIGGSLRDIAENVAIRILLSSATQDVAEGWLKVIADNILVNEKFNFFWPHVRPEDLSQTRWKKDNFIVNRQNIVPEGTMRAVGIDVNVVGEHYEKIICEDIVNEENSKTHDQREKNKRRFRLLVPILEPGGETLVVGTRWDYHDTYREIIDSKLFYVSRRQVKEKNENGKEVFIFPQKFNEEELKRRKKIINDDYIYTCQYYNEPIARKEKLFPIGFFKYYDALPPNGVFYTTVDPAGTTESYSNKSVVMTCYWTPVKQDSIYGDVYVFRFTALKLRPESLVELIVTELVEIRPLRLTVEIVKDEGFWTLLLNELTKHGLGSAPVDKFIPTTRVSKYQRIAMLEPYGRREGLFIKKDEHFELEEQARDYTGFKRDEDDDILDALAQQHFIGEFPINPSDEEEEEDDYDPLFEGSTNY